MFKQFDRDQDGKLSLEEFRLLLLNKLEFDIPHDQIASLFQIIQKISKEECVRCQEFIQFLDRVIGDKDQENQLYLKQSQEKNDDTYGRLIAKLKVLRNPENCADFKEQLMKFSQQSVDGKIWSEQLFNQFLRQMKINLSKLEADELYMVIKTESDLINMPLFIEFMQLDQEEVALSDPSDKQDSEKMVEEESKSLPANNFGRQKSAKSMNELELSKEKFSELFDKELISESLPNSQKF